ncbi:hypothetical protein ACVXZY_01050 [Staphylococcus aureus]
MFKKAFKDVEKELGQDIPLVINGEKIFKDDKIKSINPADTSQVIANASKANKMLKMRLKQQTKLINLGKHGQQMIVRA